jgi:type IV pilus assembly protein PilC
MAIFKYKALNEEQKTISGLVDASSEESAIDTLKEKNLTIISLVKESDDSGGGFSFILDKIKPKDLVTFSRQLSVLISANVALVQAMKILVNQTENIKFKMVLSEITDEIDEGAQFSAALVKRPEVFSNFFTNVVKSGETSGKLDEVLNYLADELEKDYDMQSKIKGAMIYPIFVLLLMIVVGIVMLVFVVPKLTDVMAESGVELPLPTKILIAVSDFLAAYWWLVAAGVVGLIVGFKAARKNPKSKRVLDMIMLRLPIFGHLFQNIYLVRFTRSLQTLIIGGVNISKALGIVAEVVSNSVYSDLILRAKHEVEDGNSISGAFQDNKNVPKIVPQMMNVGEKTGKLDEVLKRITEFYTREIDNTVANLMTLMEPLIMIIMGIGVGIMVAAIILPMYQMAQGY